MNKNFKFYLGIWAVLLAIFNLVVFLTPDEFAGMSKFGGAFWVGYVFITIAFIGQLAISYFAFKSENLKKLFYRIPLIRISWTGLILTLIFGALCMIIPNLPNWVGIIACFVVLGFNAISLIKASTAADIVSGIDDKVRTKTFFIKALTVESEQLMNATKNAELKTLSKKVYEAVRYSDPMSNEILEKMESKLLDKFNEFKSAVDSEDTELATAISGELLADIDARNKKCKLLK